MKIVVNSERNIKGFIQEKRKRCLITVYQYLRESYRSNLFKIYKEKPKLKATKKMMKQEKNYTDK